MSEPQDDLPPPHPLLDPEHAPLPKRGILRRQAWITVLLPFVIYMIIGSVEPSRPKEEDEKAAAKQAEVNAADLALKERNAAAEKHERESRVPYELYPKFYTVKIVATVIAMLLVIPGYLAFRGSPHVGLSIVVGAVGAVLWVGICKLHLESHVLEPLGLGKLLDMGRRFGFNPLEEIGEKSGDWVWAYQFLAIRFFGLCLVVPIIEEFFLRGFLMRYVMHVDWPYIPFGATNNLAIGAATAYGMLAHPAEIIAAAVWFSLVTWLMLRTKCIWSCVIAHSVTNLLMGLWVLYSGDWWLM